MSNTVYIPENDSILQIEHLEYAPKYIQLERPTKKLLDTADGPDWFDFDRLYFSQSRDCQSEGGEFGWYLQSAKFEDLAEPVWISEALQIIVEDEGERQEALQLCLKEWIDAFFGLFQAKEDAISDMDVPPELLERMQKDAAYMALELKQLAKCMGYDLETDPDQVDYFLSDLAIGINIDPDEFLRRS